jgi:mannose-6-phosphate isomerase-like protein (cupin superfamily)
VIGFRTPVGVASDIEIERWLCRRRENSSQQKRGSGDVIMRQVLCITALVLASTQAGAQQAPASASGEIPGFELWSSNKVKEASARLEKDIGDKNILFETMGNWKGHSVYLVLRAKTADAEFHKTEEDLYFAMGGHATFVIGGEMVDPKTMPRKQVRSATIKGGEKRDVRPGDVVHVPRAIPHQLVLAPGEKFLYFLIKLDEEPLANLNPHTLKPK